MIPNCPYCKNSLETIHYDSFDLRICKKCEYPIEIIDRKKCCRSSKTHFVKYVVANNSIQIRDQCISCGYILQHSYPQANFNLSSLPFANVELNKKRFDRVGQERKKFKDLIMVGHEFFRKNRYEKYIRSKTWQIKRKLVFERDDYKCQSCFESLATEVHHLTYDHFENEPLFDLISVCNSCHRAITAMDRHETKRIKIHEPQPF